jgi:hypothetical protein
MKQRSTLAPGSSLLLLLAAAMTATAAEVSTVKLPPRASHPQVAVDGKGTVHLVFADKEARGDLYYARYHGEQGTFSRPIKVNSTPRCAAAFNMAVGKGGRVHVLIRPNAIYSRNKLGRQPKFVDLKYMLYCRLDDTGSKFEEERDLSGTTFGFEGVGAIVADARGGVQVFWHGLSKPGIEPTRELFVVRSNDEGKTFTQPEPLHTEITGACACCSMQGLIDAGGTLYLAVRDSREGGNKDSYLLTSKDGGKSFSALLLDPWPEAGCPGSTYSLSSGKAGVFVGWDTLGKVYFARVGTRGKRVAAPTRGRSRSPVVVANAKGEVLFAWSEAETPQQFQHAGDLAWRLYDREGKPISKKQVLPAGIARWSFPGVYAKANGDFVIFYDGPGAGK